MTRFALEDTGAGEPAVLLHGFPATRKLWAKAVPLLQGYRCIVPDLIGYGDSPGADDVGMENQAGWLLELLDELGIDRAVVVAHDVGTAAAQILTVRAPGRVRRLVLIDGVHETGWAMDAVESIRSWDPAQAARLQPVLARRLKSIRELLSAYAGEEGGRRLIHAAGCLRPEETAGITARLRATGVPVRVVWGADDGYLSAERVGRPLAEALGVPLAVLPGGHFLPLDNPQGVAQAIAG